MIIDAMISAKGSTDMLYSLRQVADRLGVHVQTIKRYVYYTDVLKGLGQMVGHSRVYTEDEVAKIKSAIDAAPATKQGLSRAQVAERHTKALELHEGGSSLSQIGRALGITPTGALRAIRSAQKKRQAEQAKKKTKKK